MPIPLLEYAPLITSASVAIAALAGSATAVFLVLRSRNEQNSLPEFLYLQRRQEDLIRELIDRTERSSSFSDRSTRNNIEELSYRLASQIDARLTTSLRDFDVSLKRMQPKPMPAMPSNIADGSRPLAREIAHALLTPLARIDAVSWTIPEDNDKVSSQLEMIRSAVQVCHIYINAFRATNPTDQREVDLKSALRSSARLYADGAGKRPRISISAPVSINDGREYYLVACALPLIENAIDAVVDKQTVRIVVSEEADQIILSVRNPTSVAFNPEEMLKNGASSKGEGHEGLGLGISKRLVEAAGGDLSVEAPGSYAMFTIRLPKRTDNG